MPNPGLGPIKTTHYSLGFDQVVSQFLYFRLSTFVKEVKDQVFTSSMVGASPTFYTSYQNGVEIDSKGFIFDIRLRKINRIQLEANYTLQWVNESTPDPFIRVYWTPPSPQAIYTPYTTPPYYDQRHTLNLYTNFSTLSEEGPEILGIHPLGYWDVGLRFAYGSGFRYTPNRSCSVIYEDPDDIFDLVAVNSLEMPATSQLDLKIERRIDLGRITLNPYLWIINVLNTKNILYVYGATGKPDSDGWFNTIEGRQWAEANRAAALWYQARLNNPLYYGEPRQIRFGIRFEYK